MPRFLTLPALFVSALVLSSGAVFADDTRTKHDKIIQMLEVTNMDSLVVQMFDAMKPQINQAISKAAPNIEPEVRDIIVNLIEEEMNSSINDFYEKMIPVYDRILTEEELDASIAFYTTPVGQSLLKKTPHLIQSGMLAGQQWGEEVNKRVGERIRQELQRRGYKS